ncbi:stemmadenine O-acetyltransferase-like [Rosa rugosa]|uniref:stemmadenine O-acetyltransferase-like n=1 Tax=Rosa rugosa TaxID=74645 RepID=UPI002B40E0DC|nr:stemmadenine O-acetyltransferase-like [Rosa rugosa]
MVDMEVNIVCKDTIKPVAASSSLHSHQKPCKLCIFDQLIPTTYVPMLFFYPIIDPNFNVPQTLAHLKTSLSHTLTQYYPFSGRTKNNLYIHNFDAGVPYLEARVKCHMFELFELQEIELLNRFVPFHPFRKETGSPDLLPLIAFQVSVFACGGISIGVSLSHKIFDAQTANIFLKSWASVFRRDHEEAIQSNLNLCQASSTFPASDNLPQKYLSFMESTWFEEKKYVTRRFVFDAKAIATLRDKAKSELVPNPTRVETLTCFLWKHATFASRHGGTSRRASVVAHAVNLRRRLKPPMPDDAIGNLFWWATAVYNPTDKAETTDELCDLLKILHESLNGLDHDHFLDTLRGEEGRRAIFEYLDQLLEDMDSLDPTPEIYAFTSWINILDEIDFGWGKPFWIGVMGKVGPAFRNLTVFVKTQRDNGIEAWVTMDEKQMSIMEKDPQFLAFASPNPRILNV